MPLSQWLETELKVAINRQVRLLVSPCKVTVSGKLIAVRGSLAILEERIEAFEPGEVIPTPDTKVPVQLVRRIVNLSDVVAIEISFEPGEELDAPKG